MARNKDRRWGYVKKPALWMPSAMTKWAATTYTDANGRLCVFFSDGDTRPLTRFERVLLVMGLLNVYEE